MIFGYRQVPKKGILSTRFEILFKCEIRKGAAGMETGRHYVGLNGRRFSRKPETWTELEAGKLVPKDHPRIRFRGQIDLLQARVVLAQAILESRGAEPKLIGDLQNILDFLRQLVRSEVLDEPLPDERILGLTPEELRAQSHDPKTYFGVEWMQLPQGSMGVPYALMNELRAQARVAETFAVAAFQGRVTPAQEQVLRAMNRLSSAFHILMCRLLAGRYGKN